MHSRVKYEGGHAEAYFSPISACRTGLRNGGNSGAIGQLRRSLHGDNFSPSPEPRARVGGGGRTGAEGCRDRKGRGWIAARFGSRAPRGTSRIGRRAISFADCRYRQPLPKYLIPKRLELSMDYKPIYYLPVPGARFSVAEATDTTRRVCSHRGFRGRRGSRRRISLRDRL
jgi:hypothetical protein